LDEVVRKEIVTVDKIEFLTSLNYFGSNLGLLPGMGVFQLLEGGLLLIIIYFKND